MLPEVVREGGCEEVHGVRVLHDEVSVAGSQQAGERPQGRLRPAGEGHQAAQLGRGQVLGAARRQGQHPGARVAPVWGEGGHHTMGTETRYNLPRHQLVKATMSSTSVSLSAARVSV